VSTPDHHSLAPTPPTEEGCTLLTIAFSLGIRRYLRRVEWSILDGGACNILGEACVIEGVCQIRQSITNRAQRPRQRPICFGRIGARWCTWHMC